MAKHITKSIRLTEDEARELGGLVADNPASESALMRQWVLLGIREFRVERAVSAYRQDEVDVREAARMAGLPIGVFVEELAERRVAMLHDADLMMAEIASFRAVFGRLDAENRPNPPAPFPTREGGA